MTVQESLVPLISLPKREPDDKKPEVESRQANPEKEFEKV